MPRLQGNDMTAEGHLSVVDDAKTLGDLERVKKNSQKFIKGSQLVELLDRIQKRKEELWKEEQDRGEDALLAAFDAGMRNE